MVETFAQRRRDALSIGGGNLPFAALLKLLARFRQTGRRRAAVRVRTMPSIQQFEGADELAPHRVQAITVSDPA